jgi:predicted O-linked N-acetylglucosamine transferase (SPINDLY family)
MHIKMQICSWSDITTLKERVIHHINAKRKICTPFPILAFSNDPSTIQHCAQIFVQDKHPANLTLGFMPKRPRGKKIRLGYFSADFGDHPVSFLTAGLFENHNQDQFEVFAFDLKNRKKDFLFNRIKNAFDHFIDVTNKNDQEVAQLARELKIDIAVDLGGFTQDARTGIFAYRAAPIQLSYIGYLGTMAAPYYDYLIADKTIIPPDLQTHYSEEIIYLPSYQVNDLQRMSNDISFTRTELGLPEIGFVFTCFNNNYKILPSTFDGWMRILQKVEGSVLFIYADNRWAEANLKKEAQTRGVDPQRLIFGKRVPINQYTARYHNCDLFLDTTPYNAGTTASDALWSGLPVLTLIGESFAARVAASLLKAIDLPELIASTQNEYEELAIELATNTQKLAAIKQKLSDNRLSTPLFNTPLFTKNIETAYTKIMERYWADLPPAHIEIIG